MTVRIAPLAWEPLFDPLRLALGRVGVLDSEGDYTSETDQSDSER